MTLSRVLLAIAGLLAASAALATAEAAPELQIFVSSAEEAAAAEVYYRERRGKKKNAKASGIECALDQSCPDDEFCSCGFCAPKPTKENAKCHKKGKKCRSTTCGNGLVCKKNKCKAPPSAAECSKDGDCADNKFCNCKGVCMALPGLNKKCHPKRKKCLADTCATGLVCNKKKCKPDPNFDDGSNDSTTNKPTDDNDSTDGCAYGKVPNGQGLCTSYRWVTKRAAPRAVGEVGVGIVGDTLYMTGAQTKLDNRRTTQAYHIPSNTWNAPFALAQRPFDGDHSATEVYNGKVYQIGGLCYGSGGCGAEQKVQIYDPASDTWTLGADVPYRVNGAQFSTIIGNTIYVCGGLDKVTKASPKKCATYNADTDQWSNMPNMPFPGHHGAGCTDGTRFWLFSGRMIKTKVKGSDIVQVYDPRTTQWTTSSNGPIAPVPRLRSGYGQCVYFGGEFYIMGGEEKGKSSYSNNGVFDIVDIYDPIRNSWREGPPMPTALHGLYPVVYQDTIIVAGGAPKLGPAISDVVMVYEAA